MSEQHFLTVLSVMAQEVEMLQYQNKELLRKVKDCDETISRLGAALKKFASEEGIA